jgi:RNA polymerase sigma factor (sigma-70 family)
MHKKLRPKFDSQDFVQSVWASFFALPLQNYDFESPEELARFLVDLAQNKVVDAVRQRINGAKYNVNREEFSLNDSQLPQNIAQTPAREPTPAELAVARELWDRMLSSGEDLHQRIVQRATTSTKTMRELAEEIGVSERTIRRVLRHAANQKESS